MNYEKCNTGGVQDIRTKRSVTVKKCRTFKLSVTVETLTSVIGNCLTDELITLLDQNVRLRSLSAY